MNGQEKQGQWWIKVPAGQFGPVDLETVRQWAQQGRMTPNDSVYNPETKAWVPAAGVPQLTGLFSPQALQTPHAPQTSQARQAPQAPYLGALPQLEKKRFSLGCIVLAFVGGFLTFLIIGVVFGALLPAFVRVREEARRATCLSNCKILGLAMRQYAQDFRDTYPWRCGVLDPEEAWVDLGMLYPNYCSAWRTFLCPSARDRKFEPNGPSGPLKDYPLEPLKPANNREVISYAYGYDSSDDTPTAWTKNAQSTVRLLADKKAGIRITEDLVRLSAHKDDGRNLLYNDGHVKWKPGPDPLDPDEQHELIGISYANYYTDWWSDPPWYGE